jgi:hypothetical protein
MARGRIKRRRIGTELSTVSLCAATTCEDKRGLLALNAAFNEKAIPL